MEDLLKFLMFAGIAAGFGIAAKHAASRIGVPAGVVPVAGAVVFGIASHVAG